MASVYEQYLNFWEPLLILIRDIEATKNSYSSVESYVRDPEPYGNLTTLTFREISEKEFINTQGIKVTHVGAYQLYKNNLINGDNWVFNTELQPYDKFSPHNQDLVATYLLETKRDGFLWRTDQITNEDFALILAKEWAAFPLLKNINGKKRGDSYYESDTNHAQISAEEFETILLQIKGKEKENPFPLTTGSINVISSSNVGSEDSPFIETDGFELFPSPTNVLEYDDGEGNHDEKNIEEEDNSNNIISGGDIQYTLDNAIEQINNGNKFIVPTKGRISSPYNTPRNNIKTGKQEIHQGTDIARFSKNDTNDYIIYAIGDGNIVRSDYSNSYGNIVIIDHGFQSSGKKLYSLYAHMKNGSLKAKVGEKIGTFAPIGIMGTTGYSTGIHLHFEIIETNEQFGTKEFYNEETSDPSKFMDLSYLNK